VVDDFGVKYVGEEHAKHLIDSIKKNYNLTEDWAGDLYCSISLQWDYDNRTVDISMPNYIKKKLQEYNHVLPKKPQYCPYQPVPKQFGTEAQWEQTQGTTGMTLAETTAHFQLLNNAQSFL